MPNPGSISSQVPYGADAIVRKQRDLERDLQMQSAARTGQAMQIGSGGIVVTDNGSITIEGTGSLHVGSGVLDSAGSIAAGTTVTSGTDVDAGRDVNATRNVTAVDLPISGFLISPAGRAFTTVVGFASAYFDGAGKLGINTSSRRYKKNIKKHRYDTARILAATVYEYDRRGGGEHELGFLAEQFEELGLTEFIFYEPETGLVQGIHYDKISVALLAVVQEQQVRIRNVEERLTAAGL
jgi:hypothetical protein